MSPDYIIPGQGDIYGEGCQGRLLPLLITDRLPQRLRHDHRNIPHIDLLFLIRAVSRCAQLDGAEGAGGGDGLRAGAKRLVDPDLIDGPLLGRFEPHLRAAASAAQPFVPAALHLKQASAADGPQCIAGIVVDAVVAAQVTGIVIGDLAGAGLAPFLLAQLEITAFDQPGDVSAVVDDVVAAAKLRIFVLEGIEAVRTVGNQRLEVVFVE